MNYKLLVLDVDGTLLNNEGVITKRTNAVIRKALQTGTIVVLASGRPLHGLIPLAQQLDLHRYGGYILAYNGAQLIETKTNKTLFEKTIDKQIFHFMEKEADKLGVGIFTYSEDKVITNRADDLYIKQEASINGMAIVESKPIIDAVHYNPRKAVLVNDNEEEITQLERDFKARLDGVMNVFRTEPYFLEVMPNNIDKSNGLGVLLDILKMESSEVMTIGNGAADYSMIQMSGLGVAMANSSDSVKRCADVITASNEEDGVAEAIEKYILSQVKLSEINLDLLNKRSEFALMGNLGIQYTYASEGRVEATMPVDKRTRQPFGILHGGASLALAETIAGLGSMMLAAPDEMVVGMQVSGNHISSAHEGDTVRAIATITHQGRSSHIWDVNIYTSTDKLVSSIRVMNSILKKR